MILKEGLSLGQVVSVVSVELEGAKDDGGVVHGLVLFLFEFSNSSRQFLNLYLSFSQGINEQADGLVVELDNDVRLDGIFGFRH
jgi:hypothetical protein